MADSEMNVLKSSVSLKQEANKEQGSTLFKFQHTVEDDFNQARDNYRRGLFGFEMKNSEGDWEYGEVTFDPNSNTMSCMSATIQVDSDMMVDQNLEALYDELINNGYIDD